MTDQLIARCASPTLAGIKTANMFNADFASEEDMYQQLRRLNHRLMPKGLRIVPLRKSPDRALLYLYRPDHLKKDIDCPEAQKILKEAGYTKVTCSGTLSQLMKKLESQEDFPHEIGLFLGYPPSDVHSFMTHRNEGCLTTGYWKVYSHKEQAEKTFGQYRKCTSDYCNHVKNGAQIDDLIV